LEAAFPVTFAQFYLETNGLMEIAIEKKLLIVEDDADTVEMLSLFFEEEGPGIKYSLGPGCAGALSGTAARRDTFGHPATRYRRL
jgi:hypothetical protein